MQWRYKLAESFPVLSQETSKKLAESWKLQILSHIAENNVLEQFQEQARERIKKNSRPLICGTAIVDITDQCSMPSPQMAKILPQEFMRNFDASMGLKQIGTSVCEAEGVVRSGADRLLSQINIFRFAGEEVDTSLIFRKEIMESCAKLLMKDPTGFSLVDEIVRGTKGEKNSLLKALNVFYKSSPVDQNFVVTGAELGAELYKKLYALCPEPKTPPKPVA